jgi:cytochrome P450
LFIPERFDPEHELFEKPGCDEPRDPLSYIPFSTGKRSCPGMPFALTELKTMLAYFLCRVDYSIPKKFLSNRNVHFGLDAEWELEIKILKKS